MNEFSIIEKYFNFTRPNFSTEIEEGIGDDAAVVCIGKENALLVSTDTLVEGVHFLSDWSPNVIAYKAVASNVSDIIAMGGIPKFITLAITTPTQDKDWLAAFSEGLDTALQKFKVDLVGGDLTRGPLTISITIHGTVPVGQAVLRSTAKVGDAIYLTGSLGLPGYAVSQLGKRDHADPIFQKLFYPEPREKYANILQKYASSAIDISDGLSSDLGHILSASHVGAMLDENSLPTEPTLSEYGLTYEELVHYFLNSGDEYEICFTVNKKNEHALLADAADDHLCLHKIGTIVSDVTMQMKMLDGKIKAIAANGFKHFN